MRVLHSASDIALVALELAFDHSHDDYRCVHCDVTSITMRYRFFLWAGTHGDVCKRPVSIQNGQKEGNNGGWIVLIAPYYRVKREAVTFPHVIVSAVVFPVGNELR